MKWSTVVSLSLLGSASAYTMPIMATRAVGRKTAVKSATRTVSKKKVVAEKPAKKTFAKKPIAKKVAATKPVASKPVAKKASFNPFAKKPVAAKPAATKPVAAKPAAKRTFGKKALPKKVVAKKPVAKKVVAKKVVAKKVVAKKVVAKKVVAKKPIAKKPIAKKPVAKKFVAKKTFGKKTVAKKPVARKSVGKASAVSAAPPASKGYPSFANEASKIAFNVKVNGGPPPRGYKQPNFADARLQIARDPAVWAAAAKTRQAPLSGNKIDFVYDDGLTVIERKQKKSLPGFLSGSAKSQIDETAIRADLEADSLLFGLDPDRFQLLFITVFGLFTLVGCLSGTVTL